MKRLNKYLWLLILLGINMTAWAVPTDYMVLRWSTSIGLVSDYHQVVDLPANKFTQAKGSIDQMLVLFDAQGKVAGQVSIEDSLITRSEHAGHDHIDGNSLTNEELVFVIRAEQGMVDSFSMPSHVDRFTQLYDWQELVGNAAVKGSQHVLKSQGTVDNRINLLFIGDGYTGGQQSTFNNDVDEIVSHMVTYEPYASYANFLSFDRLFVPSNESGADKPVDCYDSPIAVDTAFDGKFCTAGIQRLVTVNNSKIMAAAAASPGWDKIVAIVNDQEYGGSGGGVPTVSSNSGAKDIFIHEYGHSFTQLADEYEGLTPGYPICSDINGPLCEANVTDVMVRNEVKWNYFIDPSTPIPTPENDDQYNNIMGLFEGARYRPTGMYRPFKNCNMRSLGRPFCSVCQEAYVFKIYQGSYADAGELSLIEPETASPSDLTPVGEVAVPMTFSFETLQLSHPLSITWLVDNVVQTSGDSSQVTQNFEYTPNGSGSVSIKARVNDNSAFVHDGRLDELPEFEIEWQVDVQPQTDLIFADGFE